MTTAHRAPYTPWRFMRFLFCWPFFIMIGLIFIEAIFSATVTYFVIQVGKDIANDDFKASDVFWILAAQAGSYVLHAVSWIFGEQAGFGAYARYMLQFTRDNRHNTGLLHAKDKRETVEPFLTNETFHLFFELMYELEGTLQLLFGLILSALVLGAEIDAGFPIAYAAIFVFVMLMQYALRNHVTRTYLTNQRMTNRMTAQTYNAWDNIYSGNRYNFRLWQIKFKQRLRDALRAQINAILLRESLSTVSGVFGMIVIFSVMAWVASKDASNIALLVALAATLPKQIDMTHEVHSLAIGWNDLLALWTRAKGAADHMRPALDDKLVDRIRFERLTLRQGDTVVSCANIDDATNIALMNPTGRINVRGDNGAGKSTLLAALRETLKAKAYYWPTADRLEFAFAAGASAPDDEDDDENESIEPVTSVGARNSGFSSGEKQLLALAEIVQKTRAPVYLLDEWDANLDPANRAKASNLIDRLAARARVIEISHRDAVRDAEVYDRL